MATDAALQNLAFKTVAHIVTKHPRDVKRALGCLLSETLMVMYQQDLFDQHTDDLFKKLAELGLTLPVVLRGVEFRG